MGLLVFAVEPGSCTAVGIDGSDVGGLQDAADIRWLGIADAAVAGAGDLTAGDHIPDRDMVREQHVALFIDRHRDCAAEHRREDAPETVLRVAVEKAGLARFYRRKTAQYKRFRFRRKDRRNCVKYRHEQKQHPI